MIRLLLLFLACSSVQAMTNEDPWLTKVMSEFEYLQEEGMDVIEWDVDAWTGRDFSKFWLKTSGEIADSEVEKANIELVYSRAVSAYWDQQFGVRHDFKPEIGGDSRNWLSYGYIGTAPYFVSIDARLFVGEESSSQLLIEIEKEIMLTQEWVLTPELDITANGSSSEKYSEGSGLSGIEFSLRLGYERYGYRKFQPFIGFVAKQTLGGTKRLEKENGNSSGSLEGMIGIHSWF